MDLLIRIRAYLLALLHHGKDKVTTYIGLLTAGITELLSSWDQAVALLPHWLVEHKAHIVALSSLLMVWSRLRRLVGDPQTPTGDAK